MKERPERESRSARRDSDDASARKPLPRLKVTVSWVTPAVQHVVPVTLESGATIADAVAASRLVETCGLDLAVLSFAVAGARRHPHDPVLDGERVDLLRPLTVDPKEARRRRAHLKPLRARPRRAKLRGRVEPT